MGVGHAAIALGATRLVPRVNAGWLVFATFLADFLLGLFALLGVEHAHVPPDYAARHYLTFTFPYSHGLLAMLVWSAIAGLLVSRLVGENRRRVALVIGAVVLSHFLLDGIAHVAGLALDGEDSPRLGLGLWNHMPLELSLETAMAVVGLIIYLRTSASGKNVVGRYGMAVYMALLTLLTWTQLFITQPPEPAALVSGWIGAPLLFSAAAFWLDRGRVRDLPSARAV